MKIKSNTYLTTLYQLLLVLAIMWVTRIAFYLYNADVIGNISPSRLLVLSIIGLKFDISIILYTNVLFILMRFLPFRFAMRKWWLKLGMIVYWITNSLLIIVNLGDIVFYRFNGGRLRMESFLGLMNREMMKITFSYVGRYWWAYLGVFVVIAAFVWLSSRFKVKEVNFSPKRRWLLLLLAAVLTFFGMRSCFLGRPLSIDYAIDVVNSPMETNVVLNSPFCIFRTTKYSASMRDLIFFSEDELASLRSSVNDPRIPLAADSIRDAVKGKNIMLIVMEGGAQIWYDSLSIVKDEPQRGLFPFLDSIASKSLAVTNTICTGDRSEPGLAAVIGGVVSLGSMDWIKSPYATLVVDTSPRLLASKGYDTRFYIGNKPTIQHIGPLAKQMGFERIYGIDDIEVSDGDNENKWGLYDEVMGRYVAQALTEAQQPFFAGWMTLDLHEPYEIPADWDDSGYRRTDDALERCAQYTDYSLRRFFEEASKQPWYDNTLFVITADHGFRNFTGWKLNSPFIFSHIPFILFTPDGSISPQKIAEPAMAQFDIPATMLWLAGYDEPFVSPGTNWFDDTKPHYGLCVRNEVIQVISPQYAVTVTLDGKDVIAVYDVVADQQMLSPLTDYDKAEVDNMLLWLRSFLQDYTTRANSKRLTIEA